MRQYGAFWKLRNTRPKNALKLNAWCLIVAASPHIYTQSH